MSITTLDDHTGKRKSVKKTLQPQGITIPFSPRLAAQIGVNDAYRGGLQKRGRPSILLVINDNNQIRRKGQ
jgi:hypothetical protein